MTIRRSLAAAATTALLLTACAGDDPADGGDIGTELPAEDGGDDAGAPDDADDDADDGAGGMGEDDQRDDAAAGGSQLLTVGLWFDGQRVPIASSCNGVDGAVLATTEGEVTITLVREEGIALRYQAEGLTAETDEVAVEEVGMSTIYRATLASDEVPAVEVEMELGDTSVLEDC